MDLKKLEALEYHILKTSLDSPEGIDVKTYNQCFQFWKNFWGKVYDQVKATDKLNPDDFYRQDRVACLKDGDTVIGLHCYTFFDLEMLASQEHSYFSRYYPKEFFQALRNDNVRKIMTMEYLSVEPEWRASKVGVHLSGIIGGIGLKLAQAEGVDVVVTAARSDVAAAELCYKYGGVAYQKEIPVHNIPTDLVVFHAQNLKTPAVDLPTQRLTQIYWENRIDLQYKSLKGAA